MAPPVQGFRHVLGLTAAATDTTGALVAACGASRGGGIQLSGTWVGTVSFEQSLDSGTTWIAKTVYPVAGGVGVSSATANGQWKLPCGGETHIRARCSAYTSGTIAVSVTLTAGVDESVTSGGTVTTPGGVVISAILINPVTGLPVIYEGAAEVTEASTSPGRLRVFNAFVTLTRAANATPYSIGDSVSDNATIGSVTALPITVSDTNDHPVVIEAFRISTTDTGPGTATAVFEVWVYNSNPTANSGVIGGDNLAYSNKGAGLVGRYQGTFFATGDGSFCRLTPVVGSRIATIPGSGAATIWIQHKTLTAFTPSANSLQYVTTAEGFQARA